MTAYNEAVLRVPMPARVRSLPVSDKGFPVPWFVWWKDGVPDFRVVDTAKLVPAYKRKLCWVCGQKLGTYQAAVIGPMCAVNRVSSEPASHRECAIFAALACPFLNNPRTKRRENDMPEGHVPPAGIAIDRNPGVSCVWITRSFLRFTPPTGGTLFTVGDPVETVWLASGRTATRAEVVASIDTGLPLLAAEAAREGIEATRALAFAIDAAMKHLPPPDGDTA